MSGLCKIPFAEWNPTKRQHDIINGYYFLLLNSNEDFCLTKMWIYQWYWSGNKQVLLNGHRLRSRIREQLKSIGVKPKLAIRQVEVTIDGNDYNTFDFMDYNAGFRYASNGERLLSSIPNVDVYLRFNEEEAIQYRLSVD